MFYNSIITNRTGDPPSTSAILSHGRGPLLGEKTVGGDLAESCTYGTSSPRRPGGAEGDRLKSASTDGMSSPRRPERPVGQKCVQPTSLAETAGLFVSFPFAPGKGAGTPSTTVLPSSDYALLEFGYVVVYAILTSGSVRPLANRMAWGLEAPVALDHKERYHILEAARRVRLVLDGLQGLV